MKTNELATKVKQLNENGMACKEIAKAAGCDVSTIYRIRDGIVVDPSYSVGKAIDDLLRVAASAAA